MCTKTALTRDEVGINKKLIGRNVRKFYCLDCLADYLGISAEELSARIEEFRDYGCSLFD